jgi:hypothetical protein
MKNIDILKMFNALNSDVLTTSKTVLSTVVLAARLKNIRVLTPYVRDWELAKNELVERYGTPMEDGKFSVPANHPEFVKEFETLNNIEHEELKDILKFVKIEDLPETMDPREFELLSVMIDLD